MMARRLPGLLVSLVFMGAVVGTPAMAPAAENPVTDGEVWNEGVEYYRHGDVTNALRVLRPLMLSKTHGARAAEVVAKLSHDRGERDEAAAAAQIALRANPEDAKANRNFTRATDGIAAERKTKHINEVLKAAEGKDPGAMLQEAAYAARQLMKDAGTCRTNRAERAVALADACSARARRLADVWIPVREAIVQSVTNQEQAAAIIAQVEKAQANTGRAAEELGDLADGAYSSAAGVEQDFTRFLKLTILPPAAMGEDLVAQSNAWLDAETVNGRDWQHEALDFTRAFRSRFPAWARAYEQQAQSDTNKPPFTAEDQAKVSALATELEKLQLECCEKSLPPSQEKALGIIEEIRELLPKDGNSGGGGQGSPQANPRNQPQNQDQKDQSQDQRQNEERQQQQDQRNEDQQDEQQAEARESSEEPKEDQEVEALLKKAQERNDEHEARKRAQERNRPLAPDERDW